MVIIERKTKLFSLNYKFVNWKNLILIIVITLYLTLFFSWTGKDGKAFAFGMDYLGYWSAGRVADEKGYTEIYDIDSLPIVFLQELKAAGLLRLTDDPSLFPVPGAPYLSFYVLPFQLLSKVSVSNSYWIRTLFNLFLLIGYLVFFSEKYSLELGQKSLA